MNKQVRKVKEWSKQRFWNERRAYQPVTAYTVTQPVIVEGQNLTDGSYPPLNYQPQGEPYPII
ncbi:hypothetical protein [Guptibacillus hwajinpoensis]|uniref:hypothetical protein n=1 Tax=Guptibacillus hwajinpoensis TaxID=208199 RepID=UPI00128B45DB|nr:hypothetical protein [Alkalihalobacillus macyae]